MAMAKKLYLIYSMDEGINEKTIAISEPAEGLDKSKVDAVANMILNMKALDSDGHIASEYKGAEYRETIIEKVA